MTGWTALRGFVGAVVVAAGLWLACGGSAAAETQPPIKGEVVLTQQSGFTRLAFHFDQEVAIKIAESSGILIVSFSKPVNIQVEQLAGQGEDLIRAARS